MCCCYKALKVLEEFRDCVYADLECRAMSNRTGDVRQYVMMYTCGGRTLCFKYDAMNPMMVVRCLRDTTCINRAMVQSLCLTQDGVTLHTYTDMGSARDVTVTLLA